MELIDQVNGFGKVMLTASEQRMLSEICNIASTAGRSYILGEMNEQTGRYERIMRDLFPMVPLEKSAGMGPVFHNAYFLQKIDESDRYDGFPQTSELRMGSRISVGNYRQTVELRVLMPSEGYFMSVVGDHYTQGCIDDLVAKLGERENPAIKGFQEIKHKNGSYDYGIADVPQLRTVLKLYEKAAHLLRHSQDTIHTSVQEMHTLREDMIKHPNIALRKQSAIEYSKALEELTHKEISSK